MQVSPHVVGVQLPGLLPQDSQGNQLHERMHADDKVRLVSVESLSHLLRNEERGDCLCGHMDESWLLPIVSYPPHQAISYHERVSLWQLVERVWSVVCPHINVVHLCQA